MKYILGIFSVIIGIFSNFITFTRVGDQFAAQYIPNLLYIIILSVLGIIFSIVGIARYKEKVLSIIGIMMNVVFLGYFAILVIGLG